MTTKDLFDFNLDLYRNWLRKMQLYDTMEIVMPKEAVMYHWDDLNYAKYTGQRDGPYTI